MNSVNLMGNIGQDLELRQTQSGKPVCSFSLAVKDYDKTVWVTVVAWNKTAETLCKYCGKGSKIGVTGARMVEDFHTLKKYLPNTDCRLLSLEVNSPEDIESNTNRFIRQLRYEYWKTLFGLKQMRGLLTRDVRESYGAQLQKFRAYDFTMRNILQVKIDLSKGLNDSIKKSILDMFDDLTYEHSMGKNKNIHYYSGWKTNDACKINKKAIVPFYGLYDNRWGGSWSTYKARDYLKELEKIFTYLDDGRTDGANSDEIISDTFRSSAKTYAGELISCRYFDLSFKKKGTVHIFFKDLDLLKKFNIFGANKKGWLPPAYGKKTYSDLTTEERATVDSFEGKTEYGKTVQSASYFLGTANLPMLTT